MNRTLTLDNRIELSSVTLSDLKIPELAFIAFFTYQYLFPQYFFEFLYSFSIAKISIAICLLFSVLGFNKTSFNNVRTELVSLLIICVIYFFNRYSAADPVATYHYFDEHLHEVAAGIILVYYFYRLRKIHLIIALMMLYSTFAAMIGILEGGLIWGHDFLQDENQISALMTMTIPLIYFYSRWKTTKFTRIMCYSAIAIQCGLIVRSFSRGGFLALSAVLLCIFLLTKKRIIFLFIALMGAMAVVSYAPERFFSEIQTLEQGAQEETASKRVEYWRRAVEMFKENPLMGKGIAQFQVLSHKYVKPGLGIDETDFLVCHSNWFQVLSELGIVGVILYTIIYWNYFGTWRMIRNVKSRGAMDEKTYNFYLMISTGLMIGMVGFMVAGSFINILIFPYFYTFTFLMMTLKNSWLIEQGKIREIAQTAGQTES